MTQDALDILALADDFSRDLGVIDWYGSSLPGDTQSPAGSSLPFSSLLQSLFYRGSQEIRATEWKLPGFLADLSLSSLERGGARSTVISSRGFPARSFFPS